MSVGTMFAFGAIALSPVALGSSENNAWTESGKGSFEPTIFLAQQMSPGDFAAQMYGVVRTDAFLMNGAVYGAGTVADGDFYLDDFLSLNHAELTDLMNRQLFYLFRDSYQEAFDPTTGETYRYVPAEVFHGLVIMDIEGRGLEAHPDSLLEHYQYTEWHGLTGQRLVNRIMRQYQWCAEVTDRAFPGANVGLFGVVRGRRNGTASDNYCRRVQYFKYLAQKTPNWLDKVDYLCPAVYSPYAPIDESSPCGDVPINSCAGKYFGFIDTTMQAFTRGPLIDYSGGGSWGNPFSGVSNIHVEDWVEDDPVRDADGDIFKICPLITVQIYNPHSCHDGEALVDPMVDPTLESTLQVMTDYLNNLVFTEQPETVDCYAYYLGAEDLSDPLRRTLTTLSWPVLGDYNGNGRVGDGDDRIFTRRWTAGNVNADLNGDGQVNMTDRAIMDAAMENY